MELATLMQYAAQLNEQQLQLGQQAQQVFGGASAAATESSNILTTAGQNAAAAEKTKLEGQLKTEQARLSAADSFGTNIGSQTDVITGLAEIMRGTAIDLIQKQERVSEIEANSDLLGNPLGWLEDLVVGDGARAARDAAAQKFDTTNKLAMSLNAATQSTVQTQNAINQTLNAKSIEQLSQVEAAKYQVQANDAKIEAAKLDIAMLSAPFEASSAIFQRSAQMYNMQMNAEQMALARAERSERLKDKKELEAGFQDTVNNIHAYEKAFNLPLTPEAAIKRHYGTNSQLGKFLLDRDVSGMRINQAGSTAGALGSTPAETYSRVQAENLEVPTAWQPSVRVIEEAEVAFNQYLDTPIKEVKDHNYGKTPRTFLKGEALTQRFNTFVEQTAQAKQMVVEHGTNNPYAPTDIPTTLAQPTAEVKEILGSKFKTAVLDKFTATNNQDPSPPQMLDMAADAILKGELTTQEAVAAGTLFYREGIKAKGAHGGFSSMAVPISGMYRVNAKELIKTPAGKGSAARAFLASGSGSFGFSTEPFTEEQRAAQKQGKLVYNLTDPTEYATLLNITMAKRRAAQISAQMKGTQQ